MSTYMIYYKDGVKMMRPVHSREEYLALRNGGEQQQLVQRIRGGEDGLKSKLVQMNYSCLPNDDGTLKGSKRMSTTVGMDIDHIPWEQMREVKERVLAKKDELGLLMLEESARSYPQRGEGGYHLAFKRRLELSQEENLKWASELLGVAYDDGAKDITRVFFTTTEKELVFLDDEIFNPSPDLPRGGGERDVQKVSPRGDLEGVAFPKDYHGIPFTDIITKYWEVNNRGFEPTQGDRDTLTYQLACDLRHICGRNFEWLDQVIPCYDGFPIEEKRAKIKSALASEFNGFPIRLRNVLNALQMEDGRCRMEDVDDEEAEANSSLFTFHSSLKRMPQGIRESIDAVGPQLAMPVVTAVCPCIGALATGVTLDVHGQKKGLNLISYIAGDFASGKGSIDPVSMLQTK